MTNVTEGSALHALPLSCSTVLFTTTQEQGGIGRPGCHHYLEQGAVLVSGIQEPVYSLLDCSECLPGLCMQLFLPRGPHLQQVGSSLDSALTILSGNGLCLPLDT